MGSRARNDAVTRRERGLRVSILGTACSEGGCEGKGELTVDTGALTAGTYLFSLVLCTWPISLGHHSSQQPASLSRLGLLAPSQRMVVA